MIGSHAGGLGLSTKVDLTNLRLDEIKMKLILMKEPYIRSLRLYISILNLLCFYYVCTNSKWIQLNVSFSGEQVLVSMGKTQAQHIKYKFGVGVVSDEAVNKEDLEASLQQRKLADPAPENKESSWTFSEF